MPSLGWQELTIVLVLLLLLALLWILPMVIVARAAQSKGGYTPWVAIALMGLFGWVLNFFWAGVWWLIVGRGLSQPSWKFSSGVHWTSMSPNPPETGVD